MAPTATCQGLTQKGTRCRLPASQSPADDPRFCHRFHQPSHRPHSQFKTTASETAHG